MRVINIFDEINEETGKEILEKIMQYTIENQQVLEENEYIIDEYKSRLEPITVNICCNGGSAYHGFAIIDALRDTGSKIITKAFGQVASMGLGIFLVGDVRLAGKNTHFLYHGCLGVSEGNMPTITQYVSELQEINEKFKNLMYEQDCTMEEDLLDHYINNGLDFSFDYETAKRYNIVTE